MALLLVNRQRRIVWANPRAVTMFGLPHDGRPTPLSKVLPRLGSWPSTERVVSATVEPAVRTAAAVDAQGQRFAVEVTASAIDFKGEELQLLELAAPGAAPSAEGAADLRQRARALDASVDGISVTDVRAPGMPFVYVNPAFERITGQRAEDVLGRGPHALRCELIDGDTSSLRDAVVAGTVWSAMVLCYHPGATPTWVKLSSFPVPRSDGTVSHYITIYADITHYRRNEEMLQLRKEQLDALFEMSPDGLVVFDAGHRIAFSNPAFERMTGFSTLELLGRSRDWLEAALLGLCDGASIEGGVSAGMFAPAFADTQPDGGAVANASNMATLLQLKRPRERTLYRRIRQSHDQGDVTVMYFRDVSRERTLDRMRTEFLSTAAHELRTPMSSIYGFSELLLSRDFQPRQQREILSTIHRQAEVMTTLINELLDLARIDVGEQRRLALERRALQPMIVRTLADFFFVGDTRPVETRLPPDAIYVNADEQQFRLMLNNALSNAYKYSPRGGRIVLELLRRQRAGAEMVGIAVSDEGIGMSAEELARVFERFYRADRSGAIPGTGLGMTIMKEIVELHGGAVDVTSQPGKGTTVTAWLPVVA